MKCIELHNGYVIRKINLSECKNIEILCKKCSDYYILLSGSESDKEDIKEIFLALPLKKDKKDKFVLGIYNLENRLVGVVDIIKNFPVVGEWMLGLILIEPDERNKGLGKITHEALIKRSAELGAKTFRIGVIEENKEGIKFWNKLGYNHIKTVTMDFRGKNNKVNVMRYEIYH